MALETYWRAIVRKEKPSLVLLPFLRGMGRFFGWGTKARNIAYEKKIFPQIAVKKPVISIGNIQLGGVGKTPFVLLLAEQLLTKGKVAVLSRGYRSTIERSGQVQKVCSGKGPLYSAKVMGDEPYLLAERLPKLAVWVGRDRAYSAQAAAREGVDWILLDDGMQHRRVKRDIEIVVLDGEDLLGGGYFFPGGLLRDDPTRLKEADWIVVNPVQDGAHFEEIEKKLRPWSSAPVIGVRMHLEPTLSGKKVALFCGIGKPEQFVAAVKEMGVEVVVSHFAPDHRKIGLKKLKKFAQTASLLGAEMLVCTEKDAVKGSWALPLKIVPLRGNLEIVAGRENWKALLEKLDVLKRREHESRS